jgi:hypothetical protein
LLLRSVPVWVRLNRLTIDKKFVGVFIAFFDGLTSLASAAAASAPVPPATASSAASAALYCQ